VNIPWWGQSYAHDLGPNARYPGWPVWYRGPEVSRTLRWLKSCGISLLRLWLFEDAEGLRYDAEGRILGLDPIFRAHLADLVERVAAEGFRVYWTFLDANPVFRDGDRVTYSILTRRDQADRLAERVLSPIAGLLGPVAWAFDLCNEPEAVVTGESGNWTEQGASWACLHGLRALRQATAALWPGVPVSIGSGWHECKNLRSGIYDRLGLELDFFDFHSQVRTPYVSGRVDQSLDGAPVVVGELGIGGDPATPVSREEWRAAQDLLATKVECIVKGRYEAAFLWYLPEMEARDRGGLIYRSEVSRALHQAAAAQGSIIPSPLAFHLR
jgi:hypothetical protein